MAAVADVLNSFQHITSLLQELITSRAHKAETRTEAPGMLREVQEHSFLFIAKMLYNVCIAI